MMKQTLFDSDAVHKIMDRYSEKQNMRILKASRIKSSQCNNVRYTEGDEVFH